MDGTNNNSPELPLPEVTHSATGEQQLYTTPSIEKKSGSGEGASSGQPSISAQQLVVQDQAQSAVSIVSDPAGNQASASIVATVADDTDVIEKEWVARAKSIVESTRHDPHLQSTELTKFKAEYIKHRFQKEMKRSDEKS